MRYLVLLLVLSSCGPGRVPQGKQLATFEHEGMRVGVFADGQAYRADGSGWSHLAQVFDPKWNDRLVERDGEWFKVGPKGKEYALARRFTCDFETAKDVRTLVGIEEGKSGFTAFTLQSPKAPEVKDYVALRKKLLKGEGRFLDSELAVVDGALRCVAVPPSRGMVCSKTSISTELLRYVDGDEVWYRARYKLAPGNIGFTTLVDLEATGFEKHSGIRLCLRGGKHLACELKFVGKPMYAQPRGKEMEFPRDRWVTVVWAMTLGEKGRVRIWQDGALLVDAKGRTLPLSFAIYDKLEIGLSAIAGPEKAVLLMDDVEISDKALKTD